MLLIIQTVCELCAKHMLYTYKLGVRTCMTEFSVARTVCSYIACRQGYCKWRVGDASADKEKGQLKWHFRYGTRLLLPVLFEDFEQLCPIAARVKRQRWTLKCMPKPKYTEVTLSSALQADSVCIEALCVTKGWLSPSDARADPGLQRASLQGLAYNLST